MTTVLVRTQRTVPDRQPGRHAEARTDWVCVNCDEPNAGRRRRCHDCGTTRH